MKNIFVIGLDDFNLQLLRKVRHAEDYVFHQLLDKRSVTIDPASEVNDLLERAVERLDTFPEKIDAIVGYWDFPTVLMMPILRRRYGLPGPTLESVLKCEHKYWARIEQEKTLPDIIPPYALMDPFCESALENPPLPYPFWLKPVKAHSSKLGFRVRGADDYRAALEGIRAGIRYFAINLNQIMDYADLPLRIKNADGWKCIAEGMISSGRQCTLEGYVFSGRPQVYGIVDSMRGPNRCSLVRYQYPSTLPRAVKRRMTSAAERLIGATGLDDSPFNMEFFWNTRTERVWMLEINARISKSHSPLFEMVEGVPHNEVMIDVALGRQPEYPFGAGRFRHGAKFMLRRYGCDDRQMVLDAPDDDEVLAIERRFPGCHINLHVCKGMRFNDLAFRDSYSHEVAEIFVGGDSQRDLMRTCHNIVNSLNIRIGAAP